MLFKIYEWFLTLKLFILAFENNEIPFAINVSKIFTNSIVLKAEKVLESVIRQISNQEKYKNYSFSWFKYTFDYQGR